MMQALIEILYTSFHVWLGSGQYQTNNRLSEMKLFLFPKVFLAADGDISDIHEAGMPFEEGAKAGKNGLDLFFRDDREDHFEALLLAEHEVCLPNSMVSFA